MIIKYRKRVLQEGKTGGSQGSRSHDSERVDVALNTFVFPANVCGVVPLCSGRGIKVIHSIPVPGAVEGNTSAGAIRVDISRNALVRISLIRNSIVFLHRVGGVEMVGAGCTPEAIEGNGRGLLVDENVARGAFRYETKLVICVF